MTAERRAATKRTGSVGFNMSADEQGKEKAVKALNDFLRPEFINRVDEIIYFHRLAEENIRAIASLMLEGSSAPRWPSAAPPSPGTRASSPILPERATALPTARAISSVSSRRTSKMPSLPRSSIISRARQKLVGLTVQDGKIVVLAI